MRSEFKPDEGFASALDAADPLAEFRDRFHLPRRRDGSVLPYFAGNSLGLQPLAVADVVGRELEDWATLGVDAHFEGRTPWFSYHERLREPLARLVGGLPIEVVAMNSLTVNLHLMLVSFYRPTPERHAILVEDCAFPSDTYAVSSQIRHHGFDPDHSLLVAGSRDGAGSPTTEEIVELIRRRGAEISVVLLGGVNYFTGQLFDMEQITEAAHEEGCLVGFDLAHAVGNVPLGLHGWGVDFAVWCSYKYLNGGPGAVAGCFVHEKHVARLDLQRFAGWWGNDPERRFRMHLEREFQPRPTADGWQLSNPPILAMAPLRASLGIFAEAGMEALRSKSRRMAEYLRCWVDHAGAGRVDVLTPDESRARGCQLSLRIREAPEELFGKLRDGGIVGDFRPPDVIRVAPVPLYNTFQEIWQLGRLLEPGSRSPR